MFTVQHDEDDVHMIIWITFHDKLVIFKILPNFQYFPPKLIYTIGGVSKNQTAKQGKVLLLLLYSWHSVMNQQIKFKCANEYMSITE